MEMGPRTGRLSAFPQYWVNAVVPLNLSEPVAAGQMYSCGPGKKKEKCYYWRYSQQQCRRECHKPEVFKRIQSGIRPLFILDKSFLIAC